VSGGEKRKTKKRKCDKAHGGENTGPRALKERFSEGQLPRRMERSVRQDAGWASWQRLEREGKKKSEKDGVKKGAQSKAKEKVYPIKIKHKRREGSQKSLSKCNDIQEGWETSWGLSKRTGNFLITLKPFLRVSV